MVVVYVSDPIRRVIGEFEIEDIIHDNVQELWTKTKSHAGISKKRFLEYFTNKSKGYAIQVRRMRMYDAPLALNSLMVSSPPQSFMYL